MSTTRTTYNSAIGTSTITITKNANGTYTIPAGLLAYITANPVGALAALNIGTTNGGGELILDEAIDAGAEEVFSVGKVFAAATLLYINGITSSTQIKFKFI